MTRVLKTALVIFAACLCQTNLTQFIRFQGIAPDFMIAALVALAEHYGPYGGFCCGALMALLYDSTVGYVMALNIVAYTAIGYFSVLMRQFLSMGVRILRRWRLPTLCIIAFVLTFGREVLDAGYLFLIGSEVGLGTLLRALLCCALTTLAFLPTRWLVSSLLRPREPSASEG